MSEGSPPITAKQGLTLVELLVVLGIIVTIGAFLARDISQILAQSYYTNTVERVVRTLRTAQNYSFNGREGSSWGVHYEPGKLVLFKGTDYGSRDAAFDAETPVPLSVTLTGWNDLYFDRLRGLPSSTFSVIVDSFGRAGAISVGAEGVIDRP
ncbi:MAG: hypothetical protein BMS9Abin34_310 [Patescibacteria group bacterium]|nr:MAG: hypothetical protein BMS9Abin34_310 [Patescibacteria group bacterium]